MRALLCLLTAAVASCLAAPGAAAAAAKPIRPADMLPHLRALERIAGASHGTRAAGTAGYDRSAEYVAARMRAAGWRVTRQPVRHPYWEQLSPPILGDLTPGKDVVALRFSPAGDVSGPTRVIDTERSCRAEAFAAVRPGDIVLLPGTSCVFNRAAEHAEERGAVGVAFEGYSSDHPLTTNFGGAAKIPVVAVRSQPLQQLAASSSTVRLRVDAARGERVTDNVIAELRGTSSRVVMAGGHLDSVPEGPGINDNGSGVAALIEAAERLRSERRRATVRIGFWTAEEYGSYGAFKYVDALTAAQRRAIRAYLNLDMVGSPRPVTEVYDTDDALERLLRRHFPGRESEEDMGDSSDHAAFAQVGVPITGFFTGALERAPQGGYRDPCYHRACDRLANVDLPLAARIATAVERSVAELAR